MELDLVTLGEIMESSIRKNNQAKYENAVIMRTAQLGEQKHMKNLEKAYVPAKKGSGSAAFQSNFGTGM